MSQTPVLICATDSLPELADTAVWRSSLARTTASSLREALATAARLRPRLVVVDIEMPGAAELVETLRRQPATRGISIAAVARGGILAEQRERLEGVANALLLPPAGPDWGERLSQLAEVPSRRDVRVPVRVEFDGRGGAGRITGIAQNVSISGMLVECVMPLPVGESLRFSLTLPRTEAQISGRGRVVRQQPPVPGRVSAYGVRFDELSGNAASALDTFVAASEPIR
jgi:CheY-like chemotaxis protein